ncbi:hypothetical protein ACFL0Y_01745 [Patescibacteria group bacterium]
MREVNLFKIYLTRPEKQKAVERKVKVISLLVLLSYCLLAAGIFSYSLYLKRKDTKLSQNIEIQKTNITNLKPVELVNAFVKHRLSAIELFMTPRPIDYSLALTEFETLVPSQIKVNQLKLDLEGKLVVEGEAQDVLALTDFVDGLISDEADDFIDRVTLSTASRNEEGNYSYSLNIFLANQNNEEKS